MEGKNYIDLQMQVNELIKKTGSVENAIKFLSSVLPNSSDKDDISLLITFSVANYFGVSVSEITSDGKKINAPYRMVCYQLHKDCLGLSIRQTAKAYNRQENAVWRGLNRMTEILEKPALDIESYQCFVYVKSVIQKSKEYLNNQDGKKS